MKFRKSGHYVMLGKLGAEAFVSVHIRGEVWGEPRRPELQNHAF